MQKVAVLTFHFLQLGPIGGQNVRDLVWNWMEIFSFFKNSIFVLHLFKRLAIRERNIELERKTEIFSTCLLTLQMATTARIGQD